MFILLLVIVAIGVAALVTYLLGMWTVLETQERSDPPPAVRDGSRVSRGDPTPTNK